MSFETFNDFINKIYFFDLSFFLVIIYCLIQCSLKGFALSFISFLKWVVALIITIFLLPKLQPWVSDIIDSPFINSVGLGIFIYFTSLFILILLGKALSKSMKWTGFGSMDKTFGFFFGAFKGYVVSVCLFSIINWFYPFENWSIEVNDTLTYNFIKKGSEIFIEEFPEFQEFEDTKEKIEKI